jgi:two-component system, OmpR family, phosphate regulon response regulator PhoB
MTERHLVLVVDDDPSVLLLCRVNLELDGFRVLEAADGQTALTLARDHHPDIVLLDLMLPDLDGWDVLRAMKDDPELAEVPVVILTARTDDQDKVRTVTTGAAEYITKPFSPFALAHVIQDVLASDPEEVERRRQAILDQLALLRDELST